MGREKEEEELLIPGAFLYRPRAHREHGSETALWWGDGHTAMRMAERGAPAHIPSPPPVSSATETRSRVARPWISECAGALRRKVGGSYVHTPTVSRGVDVTKKNNKKNSDHSEVAAFE